MKSRGGKSKYISAAAAAIALTVCAVLAQESSNTSGDNSAPAALPSPVDQPTAANDGGNAMPARLPAPDASDSAAAAYTAGQATARSSQSQRQDSPDQQVQRYDVPITPPSKTMLLATMPSGDPLPIDGTMMIDKLARLSKDPKSGWYVLEFVNEDKTSVNRTRRVLPNEMLEKLEMVLEERPGSLFKVSGETLVCGRHSYLLIRGADEERRDQPTEIAVVPPSTAAASQPATESQPATTSRPADEIGSPDDIIRAFQKDKIGAPVITPLRKSVQDQGQATSAPADGDPIHRRTMVMDRVMRFLPHKLEGWLQARYEADNTLKEPPLLLLPCAKLERAEKEYELGARLKISGEITVYKGWRYLLVRKVLPDRYTGQF